MKYYLIGPYPPPLGGVSVFIYRYSKTLETEGKKVVNIDFSKLSKLEKVGQCIRFWILPEKAVYHINGFAFAVMLALSLRPFTSRIIFHDHSGRFIEQLNGVQEFVFRRFLKKVDEYRLVGKHLMGFYERGGYYLAPKKIKVEPAFLPPPLEEEKAILQTYENELSYFLEGKYPLVLANAFRIVTYEGVDLYGIDMCVELVFRLKRNFPNIGLLFALAEIGDTDYFQETQRQVIDYGIGDNIYFLTGQKDLWPLFKKADLMVRPTCTDGDAISIREALFFGCSVVASNVCERPYGTVLFENRNIDSLVEKCISIMFPKKSRRQEYE